LDWYDYELGQVTLTKEERVELADYMIALWMKWKNQP
jgi:hypothetical protein